MLSREHAIAEYDLRHNLVLPDRLGQAAHAEYLAYAQQMLAVYRQGVGRTRRELHQDVQRVFARSANCPVRRIDAFCKLLDEKACYQTDRQGAAAKLRMQVFRWAATRHPLVQCGDGFFDHTEEDVKQEIAARLGRDWWQIEAELFADVIEFQRLLRFTGYPSATALLSRYNVAQVQVALFDATQLTIRARADFKTILRHAKLARLMHTIRRRGPDLYEITLDGPASLLRHTQRYGASMAKFLPSLLACRDWSLRALIRTRRHGWSLGLRLSHRDGLSSPQSAPDAFDSLLEERFAQQWGDQPRDGWTLHRETAVLHRGQKVYVPDFEFRHEDGRTALLEIVGFWTPEYLQAKCESLAAFRDQPILLAVAHATDERFPDIGLPRVVYKTVLKLKDVLAWLHGL